MSSTLTGVSGLNSLTLGANTAIQTLTPRSPNSFLNIMKGLFGFVANRAGIDTSGIDPKYGGLLEKQTELQEQMQLVSLYSNIIKSEHETQMAAVRNIRVG